MSISSIPSPADHRPEEFELQVGRKVATVCVPKKLAEQISPEDLEIVIAETRRIGNILEKSGRDFEIEEMFRSQIKRQLENAERHREYVIYEAVMKKFGVEKYLDEQGMLRYLLQKHKIRERRNVLIQRTQHIIDQGWEKGTVVESVSGVRKVYTIQALSKECKLSFQNCSINNSDPLGFRTRTN